MDIGPDNLPERSTMTVEISPLIHRFMLKWRRIIAQAGFLWLKLLCVMAERQTGGPFDLWGEGFWR
jgi:hypothetical protein